MTFEILAMICALGQAPRECLPETARSHFLLGEERSDLACMRRAQMGAAQLAIRPGPGEYLKFMCLRK